MISLYYKIISNCKDLLPLASVVLLSTSINAQFSRSDSLRGSITPERSWWNVLHYDLAITVDPTEKSIAGSNTITFKCLDTSNTQLQIDLQEPLQIDSVLIRTTKVPFRQVASGVYWVDFQAAKSIDKVHQLKIYYHGRPKVAQKAPWDGGIVWTKDDLGNDFIASACQGIGASVWWPCKDHGADEPDWGALITVRTPEHVMNVSNGTMIENTVSNNIRTTTWQVKNPINPYGININIGNYVMWDSTLQGEKGELTMRFYVLEQHINEAKQHFTDAFRTIKAFEHWFGPYPFYEDGYKLVEVPYLGMEHQSSVTYGNQFKKGYLGTDLSGTGLGLLWDFIIVHESGHEWFANNITASDKSDMWIHESFTTYSEGLFTEFYYGKDAGANYLRGIRRNIQNDKPIVGKHGVNDMGSTDMYYKGANMLHTIRQIIDNDTLWHSFLRALNRDFYHATVTTNQIETYMSNYLGIDLSYIFDQYLRTSDIPYLKQFRIGRTLFYRWSRTIDGFNMPIDGMVDQVPTRIFPTKKWKKLRGKNFEIDPNFYLSTSKKKSLQ